MCARVEKSLSFTDSIGAIEAQTEMLMDLAGLANTSE